MVLNLNSGINNSSNSNNNNYGLPLYDYSLFKPCCCNAVQYSVETMREDRYTNTIVLYICDENKQPLKVNDNITFLYIDEDNRANEGKFYFVDKTSNGISSIFSGNINITTFDPVNTEITYSTKISVYSLFDFSRTNIIRCLNKVNIDSHTFSTTNPATSDSTLLMYDELNNFYYEAAHNSFMFKIPQHYNNQFLVAGTLSAAENDNKIRKWNNSDAKVLNKLFYTTNI